MGAVVAMASASFAVAQTNAPLIAVRRGGTMVVARVDEAIVADAEDSLQRPTEWTWPRGELPGRFAMNGLHFAE